MKRKLFNTFFVLTLGLISLVSCKDDPSVIKVFVRSASNELQRDARVVIVADIDENTSSQEYVDTLLTNETGFALFNISQYYETTGKDHTVAYFKVFCEKQTKTGIGYVRSRFETTAVETVFLEN